MYGAIVRNLTTAGAGPIFVQNCAHAINDAVHCTFLIQDVTVAGAVRALPRIYVDQATGKAANTDVISDVTVAGRVTVSALVVSAHSRFDVGPIVNGATRGATAISPWTGANYPGHRPMRSLHFNVTFTINNAVATSAAVIVTHRLGTANTVFFASATSDPSVGTAGGPRQMVVSRTASAADTITLQAQTQDNAANNTGAPVAVTFDVMVLALPAFGFHSSVARPHGQIAAGVFTAGNDYGAGDRQLTAAQVGKTGGGASYGAAHLNVDGLVVAPGVAYTHNMGSAVGVMALVGNTDAIGAGGIGTGYIINNATSATTATLGRTDADINNAYVLFVRPYSPYMLLVS